MPAAISCQSIVTPDGSLTPGAVVIGDDGRIVEAGVVPRVPEGAQVIDLPEATLVPGFIDLHVHGGGGFSLATHDSEEIRSYARWAVSHGVTSFLPTICAGSIDEGFEYIRTAAQASGPVDGGANVLGVNLEGPFVNPARRGALPAGWIAPPDIATFERLAEAADRNLRVMTFAPELPGAMELLRAAVAGGIVVAIGHTDADFDGAAEAFASGASHITHALNGMRRFHHREPGPVFAALVRAGVSIELIADGVHLHPATVQALISAAGFDRITLVSDGVPPAGLNTGSFALGAEEARVAEGRVLLPDGTIAGSAETLDHIVRNIVLGQAADLSSAARMASTVPARVLGLDNRKGRIAPGYDADLVALDAGLNVAMTWVQGRVVYARPGGAIY